jgi:hypothetical protein
MLLDCMGLMPFVLLSTCPADYMKPLNRLPAYYIGCLTGLLWVHHSEKLKAIVHKGGAKLTKV